MVADGEEILGDLRGCEVGVVIGQLVLMGEVVLRSYLSKSFSLLNLSLMMVPWVMFPSSIFFINNLWGYGYVRWNINFSFASENHLYGSLAGRDQ